MNDQHRMLDEVRGAVTDMAEVVSALSELLPSEAYLPIRDRLWGMGRHVEAMNALAHQQRQDGGEG